MQLGRRSGAPVGAELSAGKRPAFTMGQDKLILQAMQAGCDAAAKEAANPRSFQEAWSKLRR